MARRGRRTGTHTMGASIEPTGVDTYRIRWSQLEEGERRQRQFTVRGTRADAEAYRALVVRDREAKGYHDPHEHRARYAPPASLVDGMLAWLDAAEKDGLAASSARLYRGLVTTLAEAIYEATGTPETEPLPVTILGRPLFDKLKPILQRRGETLPRRALLQLWNTWGWLADDPSTWTHIPARPSTKRGYIPKGHVYGPTIAPTLAHCDAALRHLQLSRSRNDSLGLALIMRYTGLRLRQVQAIRREDIDLKAGTLTVRTGKSAQERAAMRRVPLPRHLMGEALFRALIEGRSADERVIHAENTSSIRKAWEAATKAEEVPRHTWAPPNRILARPDHAFRAALQAHLTSERVAPDIINYLVGHAQGLRGTHYGRDLDEEARAAVDGLPPVDWTGPEQPEGVVRFEARKSAG